MAICFCHFVNSVGSIRSIKLAFSDFKANKRAMVTLISNHYRNGVRKTEIPLLYDTYNYYIIGSSKLNVITSIKLDDKTAFPNKSMIHTNNNQRETILIRRDSC